MYWYVKLILYLVLLTVVLLIGRCGYRLIFNPASDPSVSNSESADNSETSSDNKTGSETEKEDESDGNRVYETRISSQHQRLLKAASSQLKEENLLGARRLARRVIEDDTVDKFDTAWRRAAEIISKVNSVLVNSDVPAPEKIRYQVESGDNLSLIARRFNTTVEAIQRMNNIAPDSSRIYPGMTLLVYDGDWSIMVSKEHFVLMLFDDQRIFKVYDVGIGRQDRTPTGTFVIHNKLREPTWTPPGRVILFGHPDNVLGTRWLGLLPVKETDPALSGYGIHGTWERDTVGTAASQGCVRMRNEDVEELYDLIPHPPGSEERLRNDPGLGVLVTVKE